MRHDTERAAMVERTAMRRKLALEKQRRGLALLVEGLSA